MTLAGPLKLLILGGARSGKSSHAQARAEALDEKLIYIATAQPFDEEMAGRITRHQIDRDERWTTIETPLDLPAAISLHATIGTVVLVDCLTLWTSNLLLAKHDMGNAIEELVSAITHAQGDLILVSNEVGLGIVPDNALARAFRDAAGTMNQAVARQATEVQFIAAGLPIRLK